MKVFIIEFTVGKTKISQAVTFTQRVEEINAAMAIQVAAISVENSSVSTHITSEFLLKEAVIVIMPFPWRRTNFVKGD